MNIKKLEIILCTIDEILTEHKKLTYADIASRCYYSMSYVQRAIATLKDEGYLMVQVIDNQPIITITPKGRDWIDGVVDTTAFSWANKKVSCENNVKSSKVFISHASVDKSIISIFVEKVLRLVLGLKPEQIFYSSDESTGVMPGDSIPEYIATGIAEADIVLLMFSDNYRKSEVCLNEMGAAWALQKNPIPVLLPGCEYNSIGWLLLQNKGIKLVDKQQVASLIERIANVLKLQFNLTDLVSNLDYFVSTISDQSKSLEKGNGSNETLGIREKLRMINMAFSKCVSVESKQLVNISAIKELELELKLLEKDTDPDVVGVIPFEEIYAELQLLENSHRDDPCVYEECPELSRQIMRIKTYLDLKQRQIQDLLLMQLYVHKK